MSRSPGHQKWPEHSVSERNLGQRVRVRVAGEVVADSTQVIRVDEDEHPPRYYFPRSDVAMGKLERSPTTSECPFEGEAHCFDVAAGGS